MLLIVMLGGLVMLVKDAFDQPDHLVTFIDKFVLFVEKVRFETDCLPIYSYSVMSLSLVLGEWLCCPMFMNMRPSSRR